TDGEEAGTLWKAVGIGVLACMLNPHHYRVWTFPAELIDPGLAKLFADDEMSGIFRKAWTGASLDFTGEGENPVNFLAQIALLALSLVGFAANYKRASAGLTLVWIAAVALTLYHVRAMPFLAFVSSVVAAAN